MFLIFFPHINPSEEALYFKQKITVNYYYICIWVVDRGSHVLFYGWGGNGWRRMALLLSKQKIRVYGRTNNKNASVSPLATLWWQENLRSWSREGSADLDFKRRIAKFWNLSEVGWPEGGSSFLEEGGNGGGYHGHNHYRKLCGDLKSLCQHFLDEFESDTLNFTLTPVLNSVF